VAKLKLLAEHGADMNALNTRSDRRGWTVIMNDAYMQQWPETVYLLEHGAPVDYRAPDGQTLLSVLERKAAEYKEEGREPEPGYTALLGAIRERRRK